MDEYIKRLQNILSSFLGEPKNDCGSNFQLEYPCPRCMENKGKGEARKYNLSISLRLQKFQCWSCAAHDDEMHGNIKKLFKMYGNENLWNEYKEVINQIRNSKLYKLKYDKDDFNIDFTKNVVESVSLPSNFRKIQKDNYIPKRALEYLKKRNIGFDLIEKFNIGYTLYSETEKIASNRIVLPSFNKYGELNYWTGRDFTNNDKRQKYFNPKVERKNIIFNEEKLCFDGDITIVEGPMDALVVPNSVPLLGKVLTKDMVLYEKLMLHCKGNVNIWLDGDAIEDAKKTYALLNHNRLYGKVRYIPTHKLLDPSLIYENWGKKGIIEHLKKASKIDEIYLTKFDD